MDGLHKSSLKAPAIEIIDLSSTQNSKPEEKSDENPDDASLPDLDDGEDDDHLSLYEDLLDSMPDRSEWDKGKSFLATLSLYIL